MTKKILLVFLLLVVLSAFAAAEGLVTLDAPDSIESQMPIRITVKIDDPDIIKYANTMYFRHKGGGVQYLLEESGEMMEYERDYNGEKELKFILWGTYDNSYNQNTINFTIDFVSDQGTLSKDFDPAELGYDYRVATVTKLIQVLPVKGAASFPGYSNCPEETRVQPEGVVYYNCRYKGDEKYPRVSLANGNVVRHACIPGDYHKDNNMLGCSYVGKEKIGTTEQNGNDLVEISSHSWGIPSVGQGSSEGYMRLSTSWSENSKHTDENGDVKYQVIYYLSYYQKSGWIDYSGDFSRTMWLEKGEIDGEKDKVIRDAEAFVSSASFSKQGSLDSGKNYKTVYTNYLPGKTEEASYYVYGHVLDINKNPLPYLEVLVRVKDKKYESRTDENGNYEVELKDLTLKEDEEVNASVVFYFSYKRDEKVYFELFFFDLATNKYKMGYFGKPFTLTTANSQIELNIIADGLEDRKILSNMGTYTEIRDHAVIYYRMHEAVEFVVGRLSQNIDYKLPVEVLVGKNDQETLYSPGQSMIKIAQSDKSYRSSNNPRNREYHEFAHAWMYDVYGDWPKDRSMQGTSNHDGFLNPSTADSYLEGFAEFSALAMAKYHGYPDADIYASFGSMEDNYKPWDAGGLDEEFAVASLLWDMHDSANEDGDSLTMSIDDIWRVLAVKRDNFYEYYKSFKERFPEKEKDFDELFKLHGFFYDTREGNKRWDNYEPIRDANRNGQWDEGEFFVDLSTHPSNITYEKGFTIGKATNYGRASRTQAVRVDNAFLKVDPEGPRFYKITVDYADPKRETYSYIVEQRQGLLYLHPRPDDTKATIKIVPESQDFSYKTGYQIENTQLLGKIYASSGKGYFAEHDFKLTDKGTANDPEYAEGDFEPSYTSDENMDKELDEDIEGASSERGGNGGNWLVILLVIAGVGGAGFLLYKAVKSKKSSKSKKEDKAENTAISKAKESVGGFHKALKEKHIPKLKAKTKEMHETFKSEHLPKIKEGAKNAQKEAVKAGKNIAKMAKDAYGKINKKKK